MGQFHADTECPFRHFSDSGFTYDSAGNMTNDGPPLNTPYTYNADNQMTAAGTTTFTYDGDGLRVQKSNSKLRWRAPVTFPLTPRISEYES